jgi:AcrR family transcriptional regulator
MPVNTINTTTNHTPILTGRHTEARRQAVRAARRIMVEGGGTRNVTIAAVAKSLKFTSPALYRYFPGGRVELLRAVHHTVTENLAERMVAARARQPADDVSAQLYALTHTVFSWSIAYPGEFSLLMGPDFHEVREGAEQTDRDIAAIIGPRYTMTGDTLCDPNHPIILEAEPSFFPSGDRTRAVKRLRDKELPAMRNDIEKKTGIKIPVVSIRPAPAATTTGERRSISGTSGSLCRGSRTRDPCGPHHKCSLCETHSQ